MSAAPGNGGDARVNRLLNQIRWVTSLSISLSSTQSVEDVQSFLVAALVSPRGLGYSSVLLFDVDPQTRSITGRARAVHENSAAMDRLGIELQEEEAYLADHRRQFASAIAERPDEEVDIERLTGGAQWMVLLQRISVDDEQLEEIRRLRYTYAPFRGDRAALTFFSEAAYWRRPRACTKAELGDRLPPDLAPFLHEEFVVIPFHTAKGLRTLILADRRHDDMDHFTEEILEELAWFANQGALALANAALIHDLDRAYTDLKQLDMLKSNFLSTISHELRTPLTAISGFVDLIASQRLGPLNEAQQSLFGRVVKNTQHLVTMVNDLIDITEIEVEGLRDRRLEPVDPLLVLFQVIPKLELRRRANKCNVEPVIPPEGVPRVLTDERSFGRVLFHLLDNAFKFSPQESTVRVHFRRVENDLAIAIEDRGVGIAEDKRARIFEAFYQVDSSLTRAHEGLGIGLALTKMLLTALGGSITVQSEEGHGSTFTIYVPVALEDSPPLV